MNLPADLLQTIRDSDAKVRIGFPFWLRPFLMRGVDAITIRRHVYIAREIEQRELEALLRHELTHVRQMIAIGFVRFCWRYVVEYARNRRAGFSSHDAYRRISFEQEAEAAENIVDV